MSALTRQHVQNNVRQLQTVNHVTSDRPAAIPFGKIAILGGTIKKKKKKIALLTRIDFELNVKMDIL